jgi:2-polyprenyl-3-methyl-5-hydroxy-6-metoxy-1,4-benzoquinol methylase
VSARPDPFADTFVAMAAARAVIAATRLGVFAALAERPATPEGLAAALDLDVTGTEALLTALAALGYLEAEPDGTHRPGEAAARQLVPGSRESIATFVGDYDAFAWEMLGGLEEALSADTRPRSHERPPRDPFWDAYVRGLYELSRAEHADNAALVGLEEVDTLLDVAGGHGGFAMAMCRRHPRLRATVLDLPASAAVGRRIVAEEGLAERIEFREGDALTAQLGKGLDVVSVFNFLHHLPADQARGFVGRARAALGPGGCLVVGETERTPPGAPATVNGALSGLVYFASSGTRNYTADEVRGWLREAGFASVDVHRNQRSPWRLLYVART